MSKSEILSRNFQIYKRMEQVPKKKTKVPIFLRISRSHLYACVSFNESRKASMQKDLGELLTHL